MMIERLKSLSFKSRYYALVVIVSVVSVIVLLTVVTPALHVISELVQANNNHMSVSDDRTRSQYTEVAWSRLAGFRGNPDTLERATFEKISKAAKVFSVNVVDFKSLQSLTIEQATVQTSVVGLSGTFHDIIQVIYKLDKESRYSRIAGVRFYRQTNRTTRKQELVCEAYVQTITINEKTRP